MTTIAYKAGVIAADTRMASADCITTDRAVKIGRIATRRGCLLYGTTGLVAWGWRFRSWLREGARDLDQPDPEEEATGFVVMPDGLIMVMNEHGWEPMRARFYADGSGREAAWGAMAAGATPEQAVKIAMRRDVYSGGHVMVLRR